MNRHERRFAAKIAKAPAAQLAKPCALAHPDHGSRIVCELPDGHEGPHMGRDASPLAMPGGGWVWTEATT